MIGVLFTVIQSLSGAFRPRGDRLLENLALRYQLTVLSRNAKKLDSVIRIGYSGFS